MSKFILYGTMLVIAGVCFLQPLLAHRSEYKSFAESTQDGRLHANNIQLRLKAEPEDEQLSDLHMSRYQRLFQGSFVAADKASRVKGRVKNVFMNGRTYLRFEQFSVGNPDGLTVVLKQGSASAAQGTVLGSLLDGKGDQSYRLPPGTDLRRMDTVVIYRAGDRTEIGIAKLKAAGNRK